MTETHLRRQPRHRPHRAQRRGSGRPSRGAPRVHEAGSLRVRFPNATDDALEAVIVNTGGGMTGGDRFAIALTVGRGRQPDRRHGGGGKDLPLHRPGRPRWT